MKCCTECFSSDYIKDIIKANSSEIGNCNFCQSECVVVYEPRQLLLIFQGFFDIFSPIPSDGSIIGNSLEHQIDLYFPNKIFRVNEIALRRLLFAIVEDENEAFLHLFENPVHI